MYQEKQKKETKEDKGPNRRLRASRRAGHRCTTVTMDTKLPFRVASNRNKKVLI